MLYTVCEWNDSLAEVFVRLTLKQGLPVKSLEKNEKDLDCVLKALVLILKEKEASTLSRAKNVIEKELSSGVLSWLAQDSTTLSALMKLLEKSGLVKVTDEYLDIADIYVKPGQTIKRLADEIELAREILQRRREQVRAQLQQKNKEINRIKKQEPDRKVDEAFMQLALNEAQKAFDANEVPVGCVIVRDGKVVATGANLTIQKCDPTAHAEVVAIRSASGKINNYRLTGCTLYVTLEPCPMCAGAICESRCDRVVFGAFDSKKGAFGGAFNLLAIKELNHKPDITTGILEDKAKKLLKDFFEAKRCS